MKPRGFSLTPLLLSLLSWREGEVLKKRKSRKNFSGPSNFRLTSLCNVKTNEKSTPPPVSALFGLLCFFWGDCWVFLVHFVVFKKQQRRPQTTHPHEKCSLPHAWMALFFSSFTLLGFMGCFCGKWSARLIPVCCLLHCCLVFGFPFLSLASIISP